MGINSFTASLEEERQLLDAISSGEYCCLRYGLPYIKVSDVMLLYYCGMKLDYSMKTISEGKIKEKRLRELRLLAEAILKARRNIRDCKGREFLTTPIAAVAEEIPIIGRPDSIIVENCKVRGVIWIKISKPYRRIIAWDRIRLYVLGLIIDYSPLPSEDNLELYLISAGNDKLAASMLRRLREKGGAFCSNDGCILRIIYDRRIVFSEVEWLLAYWINEQLKPIPKPSPSKCRMCEFRDFCPYSKAVE